MLAARALISNNFGVMSSIVGDSKIIELGGYSEALLGVLLLRPGDFCAAASSESIASTRVSVAISVDLKTTFVKGGLMRQSGIVFGLLEQCLCLGP